MARPPDDPIAWEGIARARQRQEASPPRSPTRPSASSGAEVLLGKAVQYGYLLAEDNPNYVVPQDPGIPCEWKPVLIEAMSHKIRALERQRFVANAAAGAEIRFSRGLAWLFAMLSAECSREINSLYWEIQRIRDMPCF